MQFLSKIVIVINLISNLQMNFLFVLIDEVNTCVVFLYQYVKEKKQNII